MKEPAARLPLTAAQLGIWLGQALDLDNTAYWAAEYFELEGALDVPAFERAVTGAVAETEALRCRFDRDSDGPFQQLLPTAPFELPHVDVSSSNQPAEAALAAMHADGSTPVDLARGPLVASTLYRLGPERYVWHLRAHHVALDGYGFSQLERRVAALYGEATASIPNKVANIGGPQATSAGLRDLVTDDQRYRASAAFSRDREFWTARLRAAPAARTLVPPQPLARHTLHLRGQLPSELWSRVTAHAASLRVEVAAWLNAAVIAWLSTEQAGLACTLGVPIANRLASVAAQLPCMAMNILPLAIRWSADATFADLARAVVTEQRAARPHQRYRYEDLRQDLGPARRLFGVVVNWMPFEACVFSGLSSKKQPLSAGPVEDLAIAFTPDADGLRVDFEANPNAYDRELLEQCRTALLDTILRVVTTSELALSELPRRESAKGALALLDGAPLPEPAGCVLQSFLRHAAQQPQAHAIEQVGQAPLDYAQLLSAVRLRGGQLLAAGVQANDRVALLLPRTAEAIVLQLAVLWLGAAYVPLDPSGPVERIRMVLDDAEPSLVLSTTRLALGASPLRQLVLDELDRDSGFVLEGPRPTPRSATAYVIYTSGSTGKPNGVLISRGALDHFVAAARSRYAFSSSDRVLQFAPLAFDASVEEIMVTLGSGGTLVLRTEAMLDSAATFLGSCADQLISVLDLPTAYFHELALALREDLTLPASVRLLIIGGEAALPERVARFRRHAPPHSVLLNTYGPTETTVVCTTAILAGPGSSELARGALPIGEPLPGVSAAVVDAHLQPVARETEGQLAILGPTLSSGYWGRPEASARRFVPMTALRDAPMAYLTGDRVRLTRSGQLVYLGRVDEELKLSGYRVNPLEVEAALLTLEGVDEAAVVVCAAGELKQLAAFVMTNPIHALSEVALRQHLSRHVAAAALPQQLHFIPRLPRDPNGKLDRNQLRALAALALDATSAGPTASSAVTAEASALELVVGRVWREVLGRDIPSLDASFFELGGHSLLALRVAERLGRALQREVPLSALFLQPTLRGLAASLRDARHAESYAGQDPLAPLIGLQSGPGLPLFCLPPADGLAWCYLGLARYLPNVALLALQAPGLKGTTPASFDALVEHYLELILAAQQQGPYRLLGWSSGGGVAHELACRLEARGQAVSFVAMLDAYPADIWTDKPEPTEHDAWVSMLDADDAAALHANGAKPSREELVAQIKEAGGSLSEFDDATLVRMCQVALASMRSYRTARHSRLNAAVLFFRAARRAADAPDASTWYPYLTGLPAVTDVDATHLQMCSGPALEAISRVLLSRLI